jgi:hypothetical protein
MAAIKTLGSSGQITLGKRFAGQQAIVEELEPGVWIVKVGQFIPDSERWIHEPEVKAKIDSGLAWAERTPRQETDLDEIEQRLRLGIRKNSARSQ